MRSEKEANDAVKNMLKMIPNYKIDPNRDPPSLQKIIDVIAQTLTPEINSYYTKLNNAARRRFHNDSEGLKLRLRFRGYV